MIIFTLVILGISLFYTVFVYLTGRCIVFPMIKVNLEEELFLLDEFMTVLFNATQLYFRYHQKALPCSLSQVLCLLLA